MKWFVPFVVISLLGIVSCGSQPDVQSPAPVAAAEPEPVVQAAPPPPPVPEAPPVEPFFDFAHITEEVRTTTRVEIQQFIGDLNAIIRKKDYKGWVNNLDESYLANINSREYLAGVSQQPRLLSQKIVLRNAEDYFINVVVPSRANDRVDDIEVDSVREIVKAYTFTPNGQRLLLYELKNTAGAWKIAN
jgi:hypothetical protein